MRKRTRVILGILIAATIIAGIGTAYGLRTLEPRLHDWVTSNLSKSLESEVELGDVNLSWFPLRLHARNLTVRHHGRTDIPPLLVVSSFTVDLKAADLWSSTVDRVSVEGLEVSIPPKDPETGKRPFPSATRDQQKADNGSEGFVIRRLIATNTRLSVVPRDARKNPKVWDIHELDMRNLRSSEPATFTAAADQSDPLREDRSLGPVRAVAICRARHDTVEG